MKFKKLLISASAIAAGSGLLATVLTSCAKASVDDKLKITLNDEGLLYNAGNMKDTNGYKLDFKDAIKLALTRSNNWVQFKNALAEEIVFKWFENRMASSKSAEDKNTNFRTSYDEWEYQIKKDYDSIVQTCKNKYGANYQFYLQNEYLAPLGGTEESYKHAKLVEKVKADFISKVFAKNYFGWKKETDKPVYPHIYTNATKNVNKDDLRNPDKWGNIGFFARTELSFDPGEIPESYEKVNPDWLAKHPDGDYAAIQDYVFNRWFKTEKPFFATAALFKYSNPKHVAHGKLDEIYDATRTSVKLPTDKPSEAFPFFGAGTDSGTHKANLFIDDLKSGKFATKYIPSKGESEVANGTITIPVADSDDKQTCLLVSGNKMFTELYTPYAMACGNLYGQMMGTTAKTSANILKADFVQHNITDGYTGVLDDFNLLKNFIFKDDPKGLNPETQGTIGSSLDLSTIYGGDTEGVYHCPLFLPCSTYNYFYGDDETNGIRWVANTMQINDFDTLNEDWNPKQPWVMEMNEAGIHVLTIDGYERVNEAEDKQTALKQVVMFRLLQKQSNDEGAAGVSADLLGESGKLKTYFSDNFTNIVLELATYSSDDKTLNDKYNVFRTIESYKTSEATKEDNLFLHTIWKDQALGDEYTNLTKFLEALDSYEQMKKTLSTFETANSKIFSYRSKQMTNAKAKEEFSKTIFENGLCAPFAYAPQAYDASQYSGNTINNCMYDYHSVNRVILQDQPSLISGDFVTGWTAVQEQIETIEGSDYITEVIEKATVNGENGFCPQISEAKSKGSNRFWYKSPIVDKLMYSFMGNKANTANAIKKNAYKYYVSQSKNKAWFEEDGALTKGTASANAFASTYAKSKVLSTDKNLAFYTTQPKADWGAKGFYSLMEDSYTNFIDKTINENGVNADDVLNFRLFEATVAYLIGTDKGTEGKDFDNFYTILNTKIGEDDTAIVGYLANGRVSKTEGEYLTEDKIKYIGTYAGTLDYKFNPDVDNMFDKNGYSGQARSTEEINSKNSSSFQWNVVQKTFDTGTTYDLGGFTGLQTKSNNQLDTASGLQEAVFNKFAKATYGSYDISNSAVEPHGQNDGCWFQFAGSKDAKGNLLDIKSLGEFNVQDYFPEDSDYVCVRKIAKKIREYASTDDLRTLAKTLAAAYDGHSDFADIAEESFKDADEMRLKMLNALPSKKYPHDEGIRFFQRVKNVEAHTIENSPSVVFKDNTGKNSYKLLMTQLNKADALEKTITPEWDEDDEKWVMGEDSPITAEEFWMILFNMASESTVQQRAITEIVKTAFGDSKLVVYDAQLYNQFDSVWIKDWSKKTIGA